LEEGYDILVTYYETVGKFVDTNYLNEDEGWKIQPSFFMLFI
jgi:hypothetical protein